MRYYTVGFPPADWTALCQAGIRRQGNHSSADRDSERTQIDANHEHVIGYIGEEAFSVISGLPVDTALRRGGDALIDFRFGKFTLDVKTRSEPHYAMLIKTKQLCTDDHHIYVHAWADKLNRVVRFWGWLYGVEVLEYPQQPARNRNLPFTNFEIEPQQSAAHGIDELLTMISSSC